MGFVDSIRTLFGQKESSAAEQYVVACETCGALRDTISRQQEVIDMLKLMVADEKAERQALLQRFNVLRTSEPEARKESDVKQVRTSRVPWSRQQAKLETESAAEARRLWLERARAVMETDAPTERKAESR